MRHLAGGLPKTAQLVPSKCGSREWQCKAVAVNAAIRKAGGFTGGTIFSNTVTAWPALANSWAVVIPATPAPTMAIFISTFKIVCVFRLPLFFQ